ncbi:MAG: type II secretion system GspH family protein [Planctomycetes bacterium]|nr:type II secretion system GspH family protein [Planctomycetota bacterium]
MRSWNATRTGCAGDRRVGPCGTTLVELTVATAIMATVFAALMPLFAGIRNSTDARWAGLEMVQNARVLNEHLCRHLAQARRIVVLQSEAIEFEAEDGTVYRCAVATGGRVEFGPVGDLHPLAGPVTYLRFAGYANTDFNRPASTPADVQLVTWEAGLQSSGQRVPDKVVTGACCLRTCR